ncbi:MAG: hypothetical protein ACI31S_06775 [Bacilli bacterium]
MKNYDKFIINLRQDESIDIYTLIPKKKDIEEYKKRVLLKSPICLSYLRSNNYETIEKFIKSREINIEDISYSKKILNNIEVMSEYSEFLESYFDLDCKKRIILDAYFEGIFQDLKPKHLILNNSSIEYEYLIDTSTIINKSINRFGINYQLGANLCLPRELYLLQLLESGSIDEIPDIQIRKQTELFNIKLYKNISLNTLKELCELNIIPFEIYNSLILKIQGQRKILKKIITVQKNKS